MATARPRSPDCAPRGWWLDPTGRRLVALLRSSRGRARAYRQIVGDMAGLAAAPERRRHRLVTPILDPPFGVAGRMLMVAGEWDRPRSGARGRGCRGHSVMSVAARRAAPTRLMARRTGAPTPGFATARARQRCNGSHIGIPIKTGPSLIGYRLSLVWHGQLTRSRQAFHRPICGRISANRCSRPACQAPGDVPPGGGDGRFRAKLILDVGCGAASTQLAGWCPTRSRGRL